MTLAAERWRLPRNGIVSDGARAVNAKKVTCAWTITDVDSSTWWIVITCEGSIDQVTYRFPVASERDAFYTDLVEAMSQ